MTSGRRWRPGFPGAFSSARRRIREAGEQIERAQLEAAKAARTADRLQQVTAGLAAATNVEGIADVIVHQGIPALSAKTGIFGVLESEGTLRFVRASGYEGSFPERIALDEPWPIADAVRRRRTIELHDLDERRSSYAVPEQVWAASGRGTLVAVPLTLGSRIVGALGFTRDATEPLTPAEHAFVAALARQAAQALERSELFATERAARMRAELLEQHGARVAAAIDAQDVGRATVSELEEAGFGVVAVELLRDGMIEILAASGMPTNALTQYHGRPMLDDGSASAEAMMHGRTVVVGSGEEIDARYPASAELRRRMGTQTVVALPLRGADGTVIGAITAASPERDWFDEDRRKLLSGVAGQTGLALDRAALYEADRRAREQAEGLQRVASAVSTAVTVREVAAAIATEAMSVLAASGVTVLLTGPRPGSAAHVLASRGDVAQHADSEPTVALDAGTVTAVALREQIPVFAESPEQLAASWPASAEAARRLGVGAIACVPLQVGDRRGAISVVVASPKRFLPPERTFLSLLARSCEQGLLRAELYEAERDAHLRSEVLHDLSAALAGALAPSDVHDVFLERALAYVEAGTAVLMLVDEAGARLTTAAIAGAGATRHRFEVSLPVDGDFLVSTAFRTAEGLAVTNREDLERGFPGTARTLEAAQAAIALPLVVGGAAIGAFELLFEEPHEVAPGDERTLATMADLCAQALERARLYENEYRIAHRLQRALLPDRVVEHPKLLIAARYEASSETMEVGGDWYDTFLFDDGQVGVAVGDVVGHGMEAAAAMGRLRSAFAAFASDGPRPGRVLGRLDRFAASSGVDFATACFAVLDPETGELRYASAGHPPMLLVAASGETIWLDQGRSSALCGAETGPRPEATVHLEPGSLLLLFSDGLVERRHELISAGLERLERAAREVRDSTADEICERLIREVRAGSDQTDDAVLVGLQTLPLASRRFHRSFPARAEELQLCRAALRSWLHGHFVDGEEQHELLLAIGEACANAVEHAYAGAAPGVIELELERDDGEIVARIRDTGQWREPRVDESRGRGIAVMEALADTVSVETSPGGTTVALRRRARFGEPSHPGTGRAAASGVPRGR